MLLVTGVIFLIVFFAFGKWEYRATIKEDVVSYYSYLPATFIEGDISMEYAHHDTFFAMRLWGYEAENGGKIQKYTMGLSMMYAPFFLLGHAAALVSGAEANGYSPVYEFFLQLSAIFYALLGLFFLRKVLLKYFPDGIVALTIILLVFGTNLFYYTVGHGPMPHIYLFCLITAFCWCTIQLFETRRWKYVLGLGLAGGLAILIRPAHIFIFLIPLLFGWGKLGGRDLVKLLWAERMKILVLPVLVFLFWIPQMAYWKYMTGDYFFWSYNDEGFFWGQPKILEGLFGFRKGWLIYTPLMLFALGGILLLRKISKGWFLAIPVMMVLLIYVIFSWWCWWYGGSFGMRPFIDYYGMLAIPLAALLWRFEQWEWENIALKVTLFGTGIFLILALNGLQTYQYTKKIIHFDSMTPAAYEAAFLKIHKPEGFEELLEAPDYEAAKKGNR